MRKNAFITAASGTLVSAGIQLAIAGSISAAPAPAFAADGCKVLLCLAGNWSRVAECVPPVRQYFRDALRGRPFPTCAMAGPSGTEAAVAPAQAEQIFVTEDICPPMYRLYGNDDSGGYLGCVYPMMFQVSINGTLWNKVYFDLNGSTSTWYSVDARTALTAAGDGWIDTRFDTDYAAWASWQPPIRDDQSGGS